MKIFSGVLGHQRWDSLLFLHWPVDSSTLRPSVPQELEIETFHEKAFVTVTPFTVLNARLHGVHPLPHISNFLELNVRTYVRHPCKGSGIWFFSLDAERASAVIGARLTLGLPYFRARMHRSNSGRSFNFGSQRRRDKQLGTFAACWSAEGIPATAPPGSLEHFLVERYALYSKSRFSPLLRLQVRHDPWRLQQVRHLDVKHSLDSADQLPTLQGNPIAHYSDGVDVEFLWPSPVASRH